MLPLKVSEIFIYKTEAYHTILYLPIREENDKPACIPELISYICTFIKELSRIFKLLKGLEIGRYKAKSSVMKSATCNAT
jgi:hypothetical protein